MINIIVRIIFINQNIYYIINGVDMSRMAKRKQKSKIMKEINRLKTIMVDNRRDSEMANYIAKEIKNISLRTRTRLDKETKMIICKKCNSFLFPGISASIRINNGKVVIKCKKCGYVRRIG